MENMENLIRTILDESFILLERQIPQTKKETIFVNISDVNPLDIPDFMKDNNIPENAWFGGKPNGYDSFDEICLCYDIDVATTDKEKLKFKKDRFSSIVFPKIFKSVTENNYKRVGFNSGVLKQFDDTTVYDMYINKDFDRLVKYYSLYFIKN